MNKHTFNKVYTKTELGSFSDDELLNIIEVEMSDYEFRFPNVDILLDAIALSHSKIEEIMLINKKLKTNYANSFLLLAAQYGHLQAVKRLLEIGEDIEFSDYLGYRALHIACDFGYIDIIEHLLEEGANPNVCNSSNDYPLDLALKNNSDIIALLLEYGAYKMDEKYDVIIDKVKQALK